LLITGSILLAAGTARPAEPGAQLKAQAPAAGVLYHGVHVAAVSPSGEPAGPADLASYEQAVGKKAAWVEISHHWFSGRAFPAAQASWIRSTGSVPFIRLMLWSLPQENRPEPLFSLAAILRGDFDADLRAWARAARDFGSPLIAEFGPEANGRWYPWSGWWNGGGETAGYGDPACPDGPERFRDAYCRIIKIMRDEEGALNITWVFHVNYEDWPAAAWNRLEQYYPGDGYIDWIGVSVYGAQKPQEQQWPEFSDLMNAVYPRLTALSKSKPIVVAECGVTGGSPAGSQSLWAQRALRDLVNNRWPRVIGFAWWNRAWQNDANPVHDTNMRVQDNPALEAVFRTLVAGQANVADRIIQK